MSSMQDADIARLAEQTKHIHAAMLGMLQTWSMLESNLAMILKDLARLPDDGSLASAIYFAPSNYEGRFRIVESVLKHAIAGTPDRDRIIRCWNRIFSRIDGAKNIRNTVAHGSVVTVHQFGKNHIRLTAPLFQFSRFEMPFEQKQLPGLSGADIEKSANTLVQNKALLWKVRDIVRSATTDNPKLHDQLRALEEELQI